MLMKKLIFSLTTAALASTVTPSVRAAEIWDGGGNDSNWSTALNWDEGVPDPGDSVTFGTAFTNVGTDNISLAGDRSVGTLTFDSGPTNVILSSSNLTVNAGINRISPADTESIVLSTVTLPSDIVVNNAGGSLDLFGAISGVGRITQNATSATPINLLFGGNNSAWTGGLTLGAAPGGSIVNVNANGLGTGSVIWEAGASGPTVSFSATPTRRSAMISR